MDPSDVDWPVSPQVAHLISTALETVGVREVLASYASGLSMFDYAADGTIWLATDIGLVRADISADMATPTDSRRPSVKLDACPWVDVLNPELVVEAIEMRSGPPSLVVTFKVQLPRVELTGGGDPTGHSDAARLGRFAAAVLRKRK